MGQDYAFRFPLPNGLHARPAGQFTHVAGGFVSDLTLVNERTGASANAKSILAVISINVKLADACRVQVAGDDEGAAIAAIRRFVEHVLPGCDEPLPVVEISADTVLLPRGLRSVDVRWLPGTAVSRGIGRGAVVAIGGLALPEESAREAAESPEAERRRVTKAMAAVRATLERRLAGGVAAVEGTILKAHLAIATDVALQAKLDEFVDAGRTASQAIIATAKFFADRLLRAESAYVRERAADVQDVCLQLLEEAGGPRVQPAAVRLTRPAVVVAENLSPRQFLALDRQWLRGLVLRDAGTTSHTIILARSFNVPTLVGVEDAPLLLSPGSDVVVDANLGIVVTNVPPAVQRFYERELATLRRRQERAAQYLHVPAGTSDGRRLEIAANVAAAEELAPAFQHGAEGIGLFRTEMLFLDRDAPPTEEEQFAVYVQAARAAGGRPVIIRTIDIGGDKPAPYLNLPAEANPFLGCRGVRLYRAHEQVFRDQVRAILRASAFGSLWLMVPMVAAVDEVRWVKARVADVRAELEARGVAFDAKLRVGIMVEVPSAAFIIDQLCQEADFFSIGTNDLTQYFLAVDRDNRAVAELYDSRAPAMLRLLAMIVSEAHRGGRWVGLCGEMGRDVLNLPLLVGLGLDEISVAAPEVPAIKAAVAQLSAADCRPVLEAAMKARNAAEVETLLRDFQRRSPARPLLDRELIRLDSDSLSKEEAIREAIDAFYATGRTEDPQQVEEAVWAREEVYSTGVGFGFAIPHCKTDALATNSIGVVRLRQAIEWGSVDGQPVQVVILMAIRESDKNDAHMRVLAQLARRLMHEDFRARLLAAPDRAAVAEYLTSELGLAGSDAAG